MNELIEKMFSGFNINGETIPVAFVYYDGHEQPYVTYQQTDADSSFSGDDYILGYIDYYDFDVYSKTDYTDIVNKVKQILTENGFVFQPSRTSGDLYEPDTGYFHKSLCFAVPREV